MHSSVIFPLIASVVAYSTNLRIKVIFFLSSNFVKLYFAYDTDIIFPIWSLMDENIF